MRNCGACRKPIRWDESLATVYLPEGPGGEGYYQACPRCVAAALGGEPPAPRTYPPGQVPRHPQRDDYLPICGLCREALFEGERAVPMRLRDEDVVLTPGLEPGAYQACPRCLARWRPVIHARLIEAGLIRRGTALESLGGNALL